VGLAEEQGATPYHVSSLGTGLVEVTGGTGDETLSIMDLRGRTLLTQRLGTGRARVPCASGLQVYRIADRSGTTWTGKVMVD
jgi:hypothetical protein